MIEVNKDNFEAEVLQAGGVVLVDWWGPKCEHCLELMPSVEELADKYQGRMKFCSVDTSGNRRLAISQKVLGLPAILFYENGEKIDELSGQEISPEDIENKIQQYAK
ncbi:MAG TPA: thioredoxin family protein [Syntrophomonadaceae bacterium]|jgi:thioredoxin 1|nr:thioredoxin family protein [Syntrophomonadaceae bacterium]HRX21613.1 thioredoxin family protein [Syntrophomonadaceae bacterium]